MNDTNTIIKCKIIIIGPHYSGKSSFVECLR